MIITLNPDVLQWARKRAKLEPEQLAKRVGTKQERVELWEKTGSLLYSQAQKLAEKTYTPFGLLFLNKRPEEKLPISDLRTVDDGSVSTPSPELLETVQIMQERQAWMRDYLVSHGESELKFVGSKTMTDSTDEVAFDIRKVLGLNSDWSSQFDTWGDALVGLRRQIEKVGVLLFMNGVVGNNTRRSLRTEEFRGFALSDPYAPLIFINNADAKSAQMFTLAHELAHIWLGAEGVSNFNKFHSPEVSIEKFCNSVAAETLVPASEFRALWPKAKDKDEPYNYIATYFRVSPVVAARRAEDLGFIAKSDFFSFYAHYQKISGEKKKSTGGDFWKTNSVRVDTRFGEAVVRAASEGRILYTEAYRLTGLKPGSFDTYASKFGLDR